MKDKKEVKKEGLFKRFFEATGSFYKYIVKADFKSIAIRIFELILLILIVCLFKIPFNLIRELILLGFVNLEDASLNNTVYLVVDIIYYLVAILSFMALFSRRFRNLKIEKK